MSSHHHPWVEIFSTPTCPDCRALKAWLENQGIPFVERDLRDPAIAEEAQRRGVTQGVLETVFGALAVGPGDYVVIPTSTTHRWVPDGAAVRVVLRPAARCS